MRNLEVHRHLVIGRGRLGKDAYFRRSLFQMMKLLVPLMQTLY